eukprot:gene2221-4316_t
MEKRLSMQTIQAQKKHERQPINQQQQEFSTHEDDLIEEISQTESNVLRAFADTEDDIRNYAKCFYVHACLFEGPAACIEATLRFFLFIFIASVILFFAIITCKRSIRPLAICYIREALLSGAAAIALLIPGIVLLVYKDFNPEDDWDIAPIPTILGYVDVRRFIVFSFGQGESASNIHFSGVMNSQDSWTGTVLLPPHKVLQKFMDSALQREPSPNLSISVPIVLHDSALHSYGFLRINIMTPSSTYWQDLLRWGSQQSLHIRKSPSSSDQYSDNAEALKEFVEVGIGFDVGLEHIQRGDSTTPRFTNYRSKAKQESADNDKRSMVPCLSTSGKVTKYSGSPESCILFYIYCRSTDSNKTTPRILSSYRREIALNLDSNLQPQWATTSPILTEFPL